MFASDAQVFVPRAMPWNSSTSIRFTPGRRRKRLGRRLMRDVRMVLPLMALVFTFAATVLAAEIVTLSTSPGAAQSPTMAAIHSSLVMGD